MSIKPEILACCAGDLSGALEKWQTWLRVEKNVSPHTLRAYCSDLSQFIDFLTGHYGGAVSVRHVADAKLTDFRAWLSRQATSGKASSSRARSLSGVKNFLGWMDRQGIAHNAAAGLVRSPKLPRKLPRPLEESQTERNFMRGRNVQA